MEDIIIIGAGIIGSCLAYDLSKYHCHVTVLDKESDVANQTSMANSAIIHTGYDPEPGTLKAQLNCRGALLYPELARELEADYRKTGAYVLACDPDQVSLLQQLLDRAQQRHIRAEILNREQLLQQEPNLSEEVIAGLSVPDTAVVTPWQLAIRMMNDAVSNGVTLHLDCEVQKIQADPDGFTVFCNDRVLKSRWLINAAGNGAQKIAEMVEESPFTLHHYRGQYYVLNKNCHDFVHHVLYPVPTSQGKGVLAVPTVHGNILLGPTRELCGQDEIITDQQGLDQVSEKLSRIVKDVPMGQVIRCYSGIRASGDHHDFYIQPSCHYPKLIHAACIDSPGLASAPAISEYIIEQWLMEGLGLKRKENYQHIKAAERSEHWDMEQKQQMIQQNPDYGKIICKCEKISRQEILDAIHMPVGATTIKGVKKRVRPGMGKCQGGFCQSEVAKILAEELGIPEEQVRYDQPGSELGSEAK